MLRDDVLEPVGVGPDSLVSSHTDNSPGGAPFGGYGMFWTQDSVARFAKFLNNDHGAVNGTQKSEGWVAMHASLAPRIACMRLSPLTAEQPLPGSRLLQGVAVS